MDRPYDLLVQKILDGDVSILQTDIPDASRGDDHRLELRDVPR